MFKNWFRRNKAPRNLDELIFDIAEHGRDEDLDEFCRRVSEESFYIPLELPLPAGLPPGRKIVTGPDLQLRTQFVEVAGKPFFIFYTSTNEGLDETHGMIDGAEALRMTLRSTDAHGAAFQNAQDSWVALDKTKIASYVK